MEPANDILSELENDEKKYTGIVKAIAIIYSVRLLIIFSAFYITIRISRITDFAHLLSPLFIIDCFVMNVIPLIGIALFIQKKRIGWVVLFLFTIVDTLEGILIIKKLMVNNMVVSYLYLVYIGTIVNFLLAIVVLYLLSLRPTASLFKITGKMKMIWAIAGITFFCLFEMLQYYFYLFNFLKPH